MSFVYVAEKFRHTPSSFDDHTTLVVRGLKGVVQQHPNLSLIPSLKVTFDAAHDRSKVSTISGGGSGHEPFSSGFVGKGFLTASASGDIFASPSARQVYGAIKSVPTDEGVILIITNYTVSYVNRMQSIRVTRLHLTLFM